jgi:hypothetical protein
VKFKAKKVESVLMKRIKIKVTSENENGFEEIPLEFEDSEAKVINLYLKNCERLGNAKIFKDNFPIIKNIKWEADAGITFEISEFDYSEIYEFLHLARPLFLDNEPASFNKTRSILGRKAKNTVLADHLKYLGKLYQKGEYGLYFQIWIGDTPVFGDKTIKLWLNGVEYHQDEDKMAIIEVLEKSLTEKEVRGIFVSQISGRVRAIFLLEHIAKIIDEQTYNFKR